LQIIRDIVLIGTGNVATRLGLALRRSGLVIRQVYGRTPSAVETLATALHADPILDEKAITSQADLYILAVSDDAITDVATSIRGKERFMVHCSGSVPMEVFNPYTEHCGVIYPLQTFSVDREVDFRNIPVCIEANSINNLDRLHRLTTRISEAVMTVPSEKRKILHLAAVFACNFPNFMYSIAGRMVQAAGLNFDVLKPLILETARKVQDLPPERAQTGPALRGDQKVLEAHLELLRGDPGTSELYRLISEEIGKNKSK
jgi:predicted short-subunit dehydrogenase-like oxidoreductase (DUF2520 family)